MKPTMRRPALYHQRYGQQVETVEAEIALAVGQDAGGVAAELYAQMSGRRSQDFSLSRRFTH
jgi:hypothetical protein